MFLEFVFEVFYYSLMLPFLFVFAFASAYDTCTFSCLDSHEIEFLSLSLSLSSILSFMSILLLQRRFCLLFFPVVLSLVQPLKLVWNRVVFFSSILVSVGRLFLSSSLSPSLLSACIISPSITFICSTCFLCEMKE